MKLFPNLTRISSDYQLLSWETNELGSQSLVFDLFNVSRTPSAKRFEVHILAKIQNLKKLKNALYLSVSVFSTKVLIGDTIFTSPNGDGTAILRGHPSHAKV